MNNDSINNDPINNDSMNNDSINNDSMNNDSMNNDSMNNDSMNNASMNNDSMNNDSTNNDVKITINKSKIDIVIDKFPKQQINGTTLDTTSESSHDNKDYVSITILSEDNDLSH